MATLVLLRAGGYPPHVTWTVGSIVVTEVTHTTTDAETMPAGTLNRLFTAPRRARHGAMRAVPIMARNAIRPKAPPSTARWSQKLSTVAWLLSRAEVS